MDSYSRKEFETMQQEAIRRVREMHKRAQSYVNVPSQDDTTTQKSPQNDSSKNNNSNSHTNQSRRNNTNPNRYYPYGYPNRNMSKTQQEKQPQQKPPHPNNGNMQNNPYRPQMHNGMNPNYQRMPMGNPFSQLFGSNLGAFTKFKNMFKPANSPPSNPDCDKDEKDEKPLNKLINGMFKDFNIDEEKIILGVLIYLLYKNGSDAKLLIALGYLLL